MLKVGNYQFKSRLFLGTGKYPDFDIQKQAVDKSGTEVLTFSVRRMNIYDPSLPNFFRKKLMWIDIRFYQIRQVRRTQKRPCALLN